jgi:phosphopantothenoylcysteine decarboxylase/phosphopantothenate--cysteine ligase
MHLVITAGGTREYIDPVRFISNASSGKMGYCLAQAAIASGHKVTLITANVSLKPPEKAKVVTVQTSAQTFDAVKKHFPKCDCLIMAAAVSDYKPAKTSKTKIKNSRSELTLKLKPTTDILKWAGKNKKHQAVVGFALEDKAIRTRAEKKLKQKKLDMIIANTPTAIAAEKAAVQIKTPDSKWLSVPKTTKTAIAKKIIVLIRNI